MTTKYLLGTVAGGIGLVSNETPIKGRLKSLVAGDGITLDDTSGLITIASSTSSLNNGGALGQFNQAKPNIITFGDSRSFLDHAVGVATNAPFTTTYRFNNGFISKTQSLTNEIYNWKFWFNAGVSGDTAQGLDNRKANDIPRIMAQRPAYEEWDCTYWVDINDAIANIPANTFLGFFYSTMRYLLEQGVRNVFVLSGIPYPEGYGGESAATHTARIALIKAYNAGMKAFCEITPGLYFIDNYNDYGGGADTITHTNDIHPGSYGTDIIAKNLVAKIIEVRGKNPLSPGKTLNRNPKLIGLEAITSGGTVNNYFCDGRTAGVLTTRTASSDPMRVTLDATDGVAKTFNIFSNSTSIPDTLMPGDVVQGFIEVEHIDVTGFPDPVHGYIRASSSPNETAYMNSPTAGYGKGVLLGMGRQTFMTDPWTVPAGRAGVIMQPYLRSQALVGSKLVYDLYDVSCRRVFTSPNAEYSASALVPFHRTNVRYQSTTAAGSITLQLSPLAYVDDGYEHVFEDVQGNASVNTCTIRGGTIDYYAAAWAASTAYSVGAVRANSGGWYICTQAGTSAGAGGPSGTGTSIVDNTVRWDYRPVDLIMNAGAAAETTVLNTNWFRKIFRANKGIGAWIAIN